MKFRKPCKSPRRNSPSLSKPLPDSCGSRSVGTARGDGNRVSFGSEHASRTPVCELLFVTAVQVCPSTDQKTGMSRHGAVEQKQQSQAAKQAYRSFSSKGLSGEKPNNDSKTPPSACPRGTGSADASRAPGQPGQVLPTVPHPPDAATGCSLRGGGTCILVLEAPFRTKGPLLVWRRPRTNLACEGRRA